MTIEEIIAYVHKNIDGRMCDEFDNVWHLARSVQMAGGGNYLEIGSLFGGSAIVASLLMKELGYDGTVYAIDPFDEYYKKARNDGGTTVGHPVDPVSRVEVTLERAQNNARRLGADVQFIKGKANANTLPQDVIFSVVYIDGDHWNGAPWRDWLLVKDKCSHFVVFDNCDHNHKSVEDAVAKAWQDEEWSLIYKAGITAILERLVKWN
jgi:hypothetical protein